MVAMTAAVFTSCKKETDLSALDAKIAHKTIPGIYYYLAIDKESVSTTMYEWRLEDKNGAKTGYYRVASTGNGKDSDVKKDLTWSDATMAEDGLSMTIPVVIDGKSKELVWKDGVIVVDGYATTKYLISMADVLRSVHESFTNYDFVYDDTTNYITTHFDTIYYLAWKTAVVYYTEAQIDSAKQALVDMADTLAWFNATYPDKAVPDTVRFSTKPQGDGTYKGQVSVPYETSEIKEIETIHGPLHIINSEMVFNRAGDNTTSGSFYFHEQTWTKECYTKPADTTAVQTDYIYIVNPAKWTASGYTNATKFNMMFVGKEDVYLKVVTAGVPGEPETQTIENGVFEMLFSNFDKDDGTILMDGLKYKIK